MDNISIIFIYTIAIYVLLIFIDRKMTKVRFRIMERDFAFKYPKMNFLINNFIKYITIVFLFIFTLFQEKTQFIRLPLDCDPIILTVSIYAMYGILISFIQFLISYSSTNNRDYYWGKSKTKLIIMDSIEYRIFNSTLFRLLLLYLSAYSILDFKKIFLLNKYSNYADSLFYISIAIIMIEFIILFIKGVMISNLLFYVQEDVNKITIQIEMNSYNEYQFVFNESIKSNNYDFMDIIFSDLSNIEKFQRGEMIYSVLCSVYSRQQLLGENQNKKILHFFEQVFKSCDKQNSYYKLSRLQSINNQFWYHYEQNDLKLSFNELLMIYIKQENLMFHFMKQESNGKKEEFSSMFESIYETHNILITNNNFFDFPPAVWYAISTQEDINLFCYSVRHIKIMEMLYNSFDNNDYCCTEILRKKIINKYCNFIIKMLKTEKKLILQKDDIALEGIMGFKYWRDDKKNYNQILREHLNSDNENFGEEIKITLKNKMLNYFITLEDNELNQNYINKLSKFMEVKYVMLFIVYRILYTGEDYTKWKGEILYFKKLISSRFYDDNLFSKQNVDFIADSIAKNSNIGHKIHPDLIQWIFANLKSPIDENLIKRCYENSYMSLSIFISFKYIFLNEYYCDLLEDTCIISDDIKFQFINEISKINGVLHERYFFKLIFSIFDYQREHIDIDKLVRNGSYEMFIIMSSFITIGKIMEYIGTNEWVENDEILKFLLIELSKFNNQKILSSLDFNIQQKLAEQFERMLSQSHESIDEYVNTLCIRASFLGDKIPQHRKEKAINILRKLVYG